MKRDKDNRGNKANGRGRNVGLFDHDRAVHAPDLPEIFRFYLAHNLIGADLISAALAARCTPVGDVEAWVRCARAAAVRKARRPVIGDLLEEIRDGKATMSDKLRRSCAHHEAGHVVVAAALGGFEISAVSVHEGGGVTTIKTRVDESQTLRGLEAMIVMLLGGRAAEQEMLPADEISPGAGAGEASDFARATKIAAEMETQLGLGEFGLLHLPEAANGWLLQDPKVMSLVKRRLDRCFERAREIVAENRKALLAVSGELERRGFLGKQEIEHLISANMTSSVSVS